MTTIYIFIAVAAAIWLLSLAACSLAIWWSFVRPARRFWAAVALSAFALVVGFWGVTNVHITYTRTVNASRWSIDFKWLFLVPLLLGAGSLALALWGRVRAKRAAERSGALHLPPVDDSTC
jgi:cbb3-type cytochrome oxidase subunit 3